MNLFRVRLSLGCIFSAAVLHGQSLNAVLGALESPQADREAVSRQLTTALLASAHPSHLPTQESVAAFSDELTKGLAGRSLSNAQTRVLASAIPAILIPTGPNYAKGAGLLEVLRFLRVPDRSMQTIVARYIRIGEDVRGPDDMQVRRELPRNQAQPPLQAMPGRR